ncbi:hypothetical protein [Tahibacter amnicola]|uniref:DUF5666 domain-containing protein n=1 Tax=Tahibacter amnicola TaxID=2976241 RepID=A0ABY6B9W1_9GAMM|nr:hypothetical protein [Tahibacter amnicola]UXI66572.1 hypothetical protein N4264_17690 [Tahibacter amnicola]
MKCRIAMLALAACMPFAVSGADTVVIGGRNSQTVTVKGSIVNKANNGGKAEISIGSVVGATISAGNTQSVQVSGSIVNEANGRGSKSEINIGSVVEEDD